MLSLAYLSSPQQYYGLQITGGRTRRLKKPRAPRLPKLTDESVGVPPLPSVIRQQCIQATENLPPVFTAVESARVRVLPLPVVLCTVKLQGTGNQTTATPPTPRGLPSSRLIRSVDGDGVQAFLRRAVNPSALELCSRREDQKTTGQQNDTETTTKTNHGNKTSVNKQASFCGTEERNIVTHLDCEYTFTCLW